MVTAPSTVEWVIGFDGSSASKHAVAWAAVHAPGRADGLRILQAFDAPAPAPSAPDDSMRLAEAMDSVEAATTSEIEQFAAQTATTTSVPVTARLERGSGASVLLQAAERSDLLVVGARGIGGFERLALGSTSTQCATHATVPTVVVPEPAATAEPVRARTILVAVDGSDNSISAFDFACAFAEAGTQITVVSVWEFTPSLFSDESFHFPRAIADARRRFDESMADLSGRCRRDDLVVDGRFIQGETREELAAGAAASDLLVVGARGRGAVSAALLGSVSTWLLHHVDVPVVVVPHT